MNGAIEVSINAMYNLVTHSFFFYYFRLITGIYVYIFFETGVTTSYESVEDLTQQWYLGGVMRSLHRYALSGRLPIMPSDLSEAAA